MRKRSRRISRVAVLALAATATLAVTPGASAAFVTRCIGTAGAVTVPGDLVVPAGQSCLLEGTTVQGDLRLQSGSRLVITDGEVQGRVVVNLDAYLDAAGTSIAGNVINTGAYGVSLDGSSVGGHYLGRESERQQGFLYAEESLIEGRVEVLVGDVFLGSTTVSGRVDTNGTTYTDVVDSTLARTLTVVDNDFGAVVCGSEIDGAVDLTANHGVQVGSGSALADCDEVNYFGADLAIADNSGGVDATGNIIRGSLSGSGNEPAPTASDNRVREDQQGQFVELMPAGDGFSSRELPGARGDAPEARTPDITREERDERRRAAISAGEEQGAAGL